MKRLNLCFITAIINFAVIFSPIHLFSQMPFIQWQKSLGGTSYDEALSIYPTADGGYIVAGASWSNDGDATGNHGDADCYVIKLDTAGNIQWQKCLGGTSNDMAYSICPTADGGYIVAGRSFSTNGDVIGNHGGVDCWIVKLDAIGNIQWQKSLGGTSYDEALSIYPTADGGYVIAGYTYSNNGDVVGRYDTLYNDYWIVKLNTKGDIQWQKCLGGTGNDMAYSIHPTTDDGYIVAGWSVSNNSDTAGNYGDCYVVKLDTAGNIQWQKFLGGTGNDIAYSICPTTDGGYIVAGASWSNDSDATGNHGDADCWIVKLDAIGNIQWQKFLGGTGDDIAYSIHPTTDGGYVIAGWSFSTNGDVTGNHGGADCYVIKLDTAGNIQWQKCLGGTAGDEALSIYPTADGGYVIAGWSSSTDADVIGHHGMNLYNDCWVVKLASSPIGAEKENISSSYIKVYIYPNPFTDFIVIDSGNKTVDIKLINISGQIVLEKNLQQGKNCLVSEINTIPAGFYILRIQDADNIFSKIMVKK